MSVDGFRLFRFPSYAAVPRTQQRKMEIGEPSPLLAVELKSRESERKDLTDKAYQ
jgi:hypothetical protein